MTQPGFDREVEFSATEIGYGAGGRGSDRPVVVACVAFNLDSGEVFPYPPPRPFPTESILLGGSLVLLMLGVFVARQLIQSRSSGA